MVRIDAAELERFATDLVFEIGTSKEIAADVANSLVSSDLRGHTSHGVIRIPMYAEMIDDGALDPEATPEIVMETEQAATIDGQNAFGQVVGRAAADLVGRKAEKCGLAAVGIHDATHLGRIGEWGERVANRDLVFLAFINTQGGGLVAAPAGSTEPRFSTNPMTYCIPTFGALEFPILVDIATSQVAHGKIQQYAAEGWTLPGEWAVSTDGEAITDPDNITEWTEADQWGAIRPLGGTVTGYKGTGLALVSELFAGMIGGAPVAGQTDPTDWFNNAAGFIALDPTLFLSEGELKRKISAVSDHLKSANVHEDVSIGEAAKGEEILLPGEAEYVERIERSESGIPLPPRVVESLRELATDVGISDRIPSALTQ